MKAAPTISKRVGIWIRVSTEDQARGESPEHHEKRARYYAESKGWSVVEVYHLEGVSGKTVADHPEAKRMLSDVKRGHISALVFSKLARLARNTRELLDFADHFRASSADLVSLEESIDTATPAGRLFYTMIAAMAHWEREEIASRVTASVAVRAKLGKPLGGAAPFGYQWRDKRLIPHPDEAPVRRRLYELFLEHKRKKTVARLLNEEGFRTRNGSKFSDTTVVRLIQDPTAKGKHRLNHTRSLGQGKKWEPKPESEWQHVDVEAIISEDLWERCNAIIDKRRENYKRPAKRTAHLFAGITFCGCGQKMYVPSNMPKYVCQKCRNKIPTDDLESAYVEQLKTFFVSSDELPRHLAKADEGITERERALAAKREELQKLSKEAARVYRLYVDEKLDGDTFAGLYKPLQACKKALEEEIPKAEGELDYRRINRLSADEIRAEATDLYGRWPKLSRDEQRSVIESITDRITIGAGNTGEITIDLAYLPSVEELTKEQRNFMVSDKPVASCFHGPTVDPGC